MRYLSGNNSRLAIFARPRLVIFSYACFYNLHLLWLVYEEVHLIILIIFFHIVDTLDSYDILLSKDDYMFCLLCKISYIEYLCDL